MRIPRELSQNCQTFHSDVLVHELIEQIVEQSPSSIAIEDPATGTSWTYGYINGKANELASRILKVSKCQLEPHVAILLNHRVSIIIACLAALKAGAAFIPLNVSTAKDRLIHILSELAISQPPIIIADDENTLKLNQLINYKFVGFNEEIINDCNDNKSISISEYLDIDIKRISPSSLAYIIYTSGSTGLPKGVMVEHSALVSRLSSIMQNHSINSSDRGVLFLNPAFDASLLETWALLAAGGTLFLIPEADKLNPASFIRFCETHRITRLVLPACFAEGLWKSESSAMNSSLKTMFVGGDQICPLPPSFYSSLTYQVINCYGPTEATIQVIEMNLSNNKRFDGDIPPIGFPIRDVELQIKRDHAGNENEGELWIGGAGLARGYWNNPRLTSEKFILEKGPNGVLSRWYATGDIVSRSAKTGAYTWLRRIDEQVKLSGFLVEPAEVERVILEQLQDTVLQTKVIVVDKRLVAFVVLSTPGKDHKVPESSFGAQIGPYLPNYMLPAFFIQLPSLPTTPNGKVDKRELEREYFKYLAAQENIENEECSKVANLEKSVTSLWSKVLNLPSSVISGSKGIFQLGGDSLQITQIGALIKSQFGCELPSDFLYSKNPLDVKTMTKMLASQMTEPQPIHAKPLSPHLISLGSNSRKIRGDNPIFLFLHPEAGTLFCYNALVHRIRDYGATTYGFQDDLGQTNFSSVLEMATYYVSILRKRFPANSNYVMIGYRFGGHLAWEMAALLGRSAKLIFLIDTNSNHSRSNREVESLIKSYETERSCHNKGVKVPNSVVALGSHRFKLGLGHIQPTALSQCQQVVFFKSKNNNNNNSAVVQTEKDWWSSFAGRSKVRFFEYNVDSDSILQEPIVPLISGVISEYVNKSMH